MQWKGGFLKKPPGHLSLLIHLIWSVFAERDTGNFEGNERHKCVGGFLQRVLISLFFGCVVALNACFSNEN